jgi:hypothetical protein
MVNLTGPANGSYFSGPSELMLKVDSRSSPERDLFREHAILAKRLGLQVIAYFDAQGPSGKLFRRNLERDGFSENPKIAAAQRERLNLIETWNSYLSEQSLDPEHATSILITEYSKKYADLIDGWWFDHGNWGAAERYIKAAKSGNPEALVAWNQKYKPYVYFVNGTRLTLWGLAKSHSLEDYTAGHITPKSILAPYSNDMNLRLIEQIENHHEIDGLVPHLFFPVQEWWRAGDLVFTEEKLYSWMLRIMQAGGSTTVAVALDAPEFYISRISPSSFQLLLDFDNRYSNLIAKRSNEVLSPPVSPQLTILPEVKGAND